MYGSAVDDDSPRDYLNRAIDILQQHSIKRETIDWNVLRSQALALAKEAQTPQETYPAIKFAIKQLKDNHSFLKETDKAKASKTVRRRGLGFRSIDGVIVQVHPSSPAQKAGNSSKRQA